MLTSLTSALVRLVAALILVASLSGAAVAVSIVTTNATVALADDDDDGDDDDDDDGGDSDEDDADDDRSVQRQEAPVTSADPTGVDVGCEWDSSADRSTCEFAAVGGDETTLDLLIPARGVCADIIGGDYELDSDDLDNDETVTYYSAREGETSVILVFAGEVDTVGSTTYWIETESGREPAVGLGLSCATSPEPTPTSAPASASAETTGTVAIQAYRCDTAVPADPETFDWYGECPAPGDDLIFDLFLDDDETPVETLSADGDGIAVFTNLNPGTYRLEEADGDWCHAESDSVDAQGRVVVELGEESTVWIFQCMESDAVK